MEDEKIVIVPLYLPESKRKRLKEIAKDKRTSVTKMIEIEVDKIIKREEFKNV